MGKLKTAIELTKNLFTTGALFQTSTKVEKEICSKISPTEDMIYVEFGMGHGNITKEALSKMSSGSKLYSFEVNPEFCEVVRNAISDERLVIVNDAAEKVHDIVSEPVDGFISSLPFTFFSKEKTDTILSASYSKMREGGFFSQILYSKMHKKKFKSAFDAIKVVPISQLPPEFIYHCQKN